MPMACKICNHPKRLEIDRELVQGKSYLSIAKKYGVNDVSLRNHKAKHLPRQLVKAYEQKELSESMNLLDRIDQLLSRAEKIFRRNYAKNTSTGDTLALKSIAEQRQTFELLAKISYALHQAKLTELETQRQSVAQDELEFQESLANLSDQELVLFHLLIRKANGDYAKPIFKEGKGVRTTNRVDREDLEDDARQQVEETERTIECFPDDPAQEEAEVMSKIKSSKTIDKVDQDPKYKVKPIEPKHIKVIRRHRLSRKK